MDYPQSRPRGGKRFRSWLMVEVLTVWLGSAASIGLAGLVLVGSLWGFDANSPFLLWALGVLWLGSLAIALNTRVIVSANGLIVVNGLRRRTVLFGDIDRAEMVFPLWTIGVPVAAIHDRHSDRTTQVLASGFFRARDRLAFLRLISEHGQINTVAPPSAELEDAGPFAGSAQAHPMRTALAGGVLVGMFAGLTVFRSAYVGVTTGLSTIVMLYTVIRVRSRRSGKGQHLKGS